MTDKRREHQIREWVDAHLKNGPLATFISNHPALHFLFIASTASFALILFSYLYWVLAWVLSLAYVLLYYLTLALSFLVSWTVFGVDVASTTVFSLAFPALFLIAIYSLLCRTRFTFHGLSERHQIVVEVVIAVSLGQLFLLILPASLRAVIPTNPLVILMLISLFSVLVYGALRMRHVPAPVEREQPAAGGDLCVVCLDTPKAVVLKPCNHFALCRDCVDKVDDCPVCRAPIENSERIYTT